MAHRAGLFLDDFIAFAGDLDFNVFVGGRACRFYCGGHVSTPLL